MRTIVVYPGRFHPFHRGHKASYDYLVKKFGDGNVFVVSSDKQNAEDSPFSFADKMTMMTKLGVAPGRIAQVVNPYQAREITQEIDNPENTQLIFAVSEKDMTGDGARFKFGVKKDGTPSYMQPYPADGKKLQPMTQHAYVFVTPTVNFRVRGADANSASQIRKQYTAGNSADRDQIIADLYGEPYADIRDIFDRKLGQTGEVKDIVAEGIGSNLKTWALMKLANLVQKAGFIDDERFQDWLSGAVEQTRMEMMQFLRSHPNREHIAPKVNAMMDRLKDSRTPEQFSRGAQIITDFINQAIHLKEFAPSGAQEPEQEQPSQVALAVKRLVDGKAQVQVSLSGVRGRVAWVDVHPNGTTEIRVQFRNLDKKPTPGNTLSLELDNNDDDTLKLEMSGPKQYVLTGEYQRKSPMRHLGLDEFAPGGAGIVPPPTAKKKDPFEPDDRSQVLMTIKRLLEAGNKIDSMLAGARGHIYAVSDDLAGFSAKKLNKPHARGGLFRPMDEDDDDQVFLKLIRPGYYQLWDKELAEDYIEEKWSQKYKDSINCSNPRGFSQRAHCQGRKK